jgi:hypothetical protein
MAIDVDSERAGAYAQERYRQGLRRWRARMRPLFAAVFGPFILAGLAVLFLDGHRLSWLAGAITGLLSGTWMTLRESPPAYIENWQIGAEGERKTEKALNRLDRSGMLVVHDVSSGRGNYDHIAVGRSGVFLLETKNLQGIVEIRRGVPHLRRRLDPDAVSRCDKVRPRALSAAASLKKEIERRTGHRPWVQAVVVLWSDFPEGLVDDGRCVFVHGPLLHDWMKGRPSRLDSVAAEEIAAAVGQLAEEAALSPARSSFTAS